MSQVEMLNRLETYTLGQTFFSRIVSRDERVSLLVPNDWAIGTTDKLETVYVGPETSSLQMNVGLASTQLVRGNRITLQLLASQVAEHLKASYQSLSIIEEKELILDDTRPAFLRKFSWFDPNTSLEVIQALLMVIDGNTLFTITSTMHITAAKDYLPIIESMMLSVRFENSLVTSIAEANVNVVN